MKRFLVGFFVLLFLFLSFVLLKWNLHPQVNAQSEDTKYFLPILARPLSAIPEPSVFLNAFLQDFGRRTGSVTTGFSIAVPYLDPQETNGPEQDYSFNPTYLNKYLLAAKEYQLPILVHLNAHRATEWSDARLFPNSIFAKITQQDPNVMMYTEQGVSLLDTPEWKDSTGDYAKRVNGVMWSLNVYNDLYRQYKKRNIQALATRLKTFSDNNPSLFVGVSLDSEISLCSAMVLYAFDWNPETIVQYRYWLSGNTGDYINQAYPNPYGPNGMYEGKGQNLTLKQVGERYGIQPASWDEVFPPQSNGDIFPADPALIMMWNEWNNFKSSLVNNIIADTTQWLVEAGIPKEKIYSHQPATILNRLEESAFCGNSIESPYVSGVGYGTTVYKNDVLNKPLFSQIHAISQRWGIFQWNPRDALSKEQVTQSLNLAFFEEGATVITPQFYYPVVANDPDNMWENPVVMEGVKQFLDAHSPRVLEYDLNDDGRVDLFDYNIFVSAYMSSDLAKADLNRDGKITVDDVNALLGHLYK